MGQLVEFESCITGEGGGGEGGGGEGCEQQLHLEDYAPSLEQEEMSEMMKVCIYYISIYSISVVCIYTCVTLRGRIKSAATHFISYKVRAG